MTDYTRRIVRLVRVGLLATAMIVACGDSGPPGDETDGGADAAAGADSGIGAPDANPSAPTCTITAPADGASLPFFAEWTFTADANDLEDGPLTGLSIQWVSDQLGVIGNGTSLTIVLDPPYTHLITCIATDSAALTGSDSITVNAFSPVANIFHPGDGEMRPQCPGTIPFTGEGADYEDGDIGASLVWTSDNPADGQFGTGVMFTGQLCGSGLNTVTATATDSDSNTATDQITLTIVPPP